MMSKHTPGPWRVEDWVYNRGTDARPYKDHVPTIQTDRDAIAQVLGVWRDGEDASEENAANAALIAAAPEMFRLLDAIANPGGRGEQAHHDAIMEARQLLRNLAKAQGGQQ